MLTPPRQLQSLGGLTGLTEQMRQRFGDTMGYRMVIYPEYAVLDRVDPSDERRKVSYTYRGGWGDATSTSAKSDDDVLVDWASSIRRRSSGFFAALRRRSASSRRT